MVFFEKNIFQNVIPMLRASNSVHDKCHKLMAKLKLNELCAVMPLFEIFRKITRGVNFQTIM